MFTERVLSAATMSLVGFAIVFSTLLLLVAGVSLIRWLDKRWEEREKHQTKEAYNKMQNIDYTTLVLITAAVATYYKGRAVITKVRVMPDTVKRGGSWATQGRTALQGSHITKK